MEKTIYKVYKYNTNIKDLLRISLFTYDSDSVVEFVDDEKDEQVYTNLFHPVLWKLEVELLINEFNRNVFGAFPQELIESFNYAFQESSLDNYADVENFRANFYMKLGSLKIKKD